MFKEIAGIEAVEFDAPRKPVKIYGEVSGSAEIWCDIIKPDTAKPYAHTEVNTTRAKVQ